MCIKYLKLFGLLFLFFYYLPLPLYPQDVSHSQLSSMQMRLSSAVWTAFDKYDTLTNEAVQYWMNQNDSSQILLKDSEAARLNSEEHLKNMTDSFSTLSQESKNLKNSVADWMRKYFQVLIPLIILSSLCIINFMGKIACRILMAKGVKISDKVLLWV